MENGQSSTESKTQQQPQTKPPPPPPPPQTESTSKLPFPSTSNGSSSNNNSNRNSTDNTLSERSRKSDEIQHTTRPNSLGLRSALKLNSLSSFQSNSIKNQLGSTTSPRGLERPKSYHHFSSPLLTPASIATSSKSASPMSARPTLSRVRSSGELLPPGYERRVGFLTMEAEEQSKTKSGGTEYSFTLQAKSSKYQPRRDSRCFLVATDGEYYSIEALDWLVTSLVEHGDEVVVLQVVQAGGSAYKTLVIENEEHTKNEAQEVLLHVLNKNDRQITVTVEFVIGHVIKTIQRMIELYRPDSLVVGTRGKTPSAWQKAFSLSSTSQYLVAKSPVPVIVVRPEKKVRESKEARAKHPKKHSYQALIAPPPSSSK